MKKFLRYNKFNFVLSILVVCYIGLLTFLLFGSFDILETVGLERDANGNFSDTARLVLMIATVVLCVLFLFTRAKAKSSLYRFLNIAKNKKANKKSIKEAKAVAKAQSKPVQTQEKPVAQAPTQQSAPTAAPVARQARPQTRARGRR